MKQQALFLCTCHFKSAINNGYGCCKQKESVLNTLFKKFLQSHFVNMTTRVLYLGDK